MEAKHTGELKISWKSNIQVRDMDDKMRLECGCLKCGNMFYLTKESLCATKGQDRLYLDEVEAKLSCKKRGCNGKIEMLLIEKHKISAFVGGLP